MKKRVLAALLVTMMTVGTVAGCGSNAKSDDSDKKQVQSLRVMTKRFRKESNSCYIWNRRTIQPYF